MVEGIRFLEIARGIGNDQKLTNKKEDLIKMFGRSIGINKNLRAGHIIKFEDLEVKKPAEAGIPVNKYQNILGMKLVKDKRAWEFLNYQDLQ